MKSEFNPTAQDLLMVESLILDIKSKKNTLIERKMSIQNSLSRLQEKYKDVPYKSKGFKDIKTQRQHLKDCFQDIELQIRNLNHELAFKNKLKTEIEFHLKNNSSDPEVNKMKNKITLLKNKYADFTKDKTRIASLRVMAAEFIDDLDKLLKT